MRKKRLLLRWTCSPAKDPENRPKRDEGKYAMRLFPAIVKTIPGLIFCGFVVLGTSLVVPGVESNATTSAVRPLFRKTTDSAPAHIPAPLVTTSSDTQQQRNSVSIAPLGVDLRVRKTIDEGTELLRQRRWSEARSCFEKASRQFPDNADIQDLFRRSRCSLETVNRFNDETYRNMLASLSRESGLALYDEIFSNILRYHVDTPHFNQLFRMGIEGLSVSFAEPSFLQYYHVTSNGAENLARYCGLLLEESKKWDIHSATILRDCISGIADLIEKGMGIPAPVVIMEFVCGMTTSLDAYSTFLTESQITDVYSMIDGHFVGLGVELRAEKTALLISRVIPNSPAERAGLRQGEHILAIDGYSTSGAQQSKAGNLLQGKEGTSVLLKILSVDNSKEREIRVYRQRVDVPSLENVHIMNPDSDGPRIGYAKIACFQKTTVTELIAALDSLERQKMACFILDLRQNPGGLLQEAIEATNLFLDRGTIVRTRGRMSEKPYYAHDSLTYHVPLVVLIDGNSASASEIFAGAIRDNKRGLIIGSRSYGKGTVQAIIQLSGGANRSVPLAGLRLTTEKFYSPQGKPYSGIGVEPDVVIGEDIQEATTHVVARPVQNRDAENEPITATPSTRQLPIPRDNCLAKAFEEARRQLVGQQKR